MPSRPSHPLQNSFSSGAANEEVVCPLRNNDGTNCRKRCLGEKRYRSMQEHIRRAHPEYYIPKRPATKESFELMINTPPHEVEPKDRPTSHHHQQQQQQQQHSPLHHQHHPSHSHHAHHHSDPSGLSSAYNHYDPPLSSSLEGYHQQALGQHDGGYYTTSDTDAAHIFHNMQNAQRTADEYQRRGSLIPAASAAAALAQLHYHRPESSDWQGDHIGQVIYPSLTSPSDTEADILQTYYGDQSELKPGHFHVDPSLDDGNVGGGDYMPDHTPFAVNADHDQSGMLSNHLTRHSPSRDLSSPLNRNPSRGHVNRPRKPSLSQQARLSKHERRKSKEMSKRSSGDKKSLSDPANPLSSKRSSGDRKSFLPPSLSLGKRWEDLIDAAASATEEEGSRDLTPIPQSPFLSPQVPSRTSLPPGFSFGPHFQSFQASPLTRALTPPPPPGDNHTTLEELQHYSSIADSSTDLSSHHHHQSSADSGSQFQIMNASSIESNTSPVFQHPSAAHTSHLPSGGGSSGPSSSTVQIYCAACRRLSVLKESFACTNCICGICSSCCDALFDSQARGRVIDCPRCHQSEVSFRQFQLDLR